MGDLLYEIVAWASALPAFWVYALILGVAWAENVLPPIPGDMIVVFGGYMAGLGRLDLVMVVLLSTVGGAAGFMSMYALGSRLGTALLDPKRFRWLPKGRVGRARAYLDRWGYWLVVANRFLSGLRSVISLSVGMAHKPALPTALYATISASVWTLVLAMSGLYMGENWEAVGEYIREYGAVIITLMVLFAVVQFVRFARTRRDPDNSAAESG